MGACFPTRTSRPRNDSCHGGGALAPDTEWLAYGERDLVRQPNCHYLTHLMEVNWPAALYCQCGAPGSRTKPGGMMRSSSVSSCTEDLPSPSRAESTPFLKISSTFSTPAWPLAASPHRYARPIITARAPSASALTTSLPRRTPPSSSTSIWLPTASAIPGSRRIVAGVPSTLLPPWLETEIPVTPASTARFASSTLLTPLRRNGAGHCSRSHATSAQVGGAVPIHSPYAPKKVGGWAGGIAMFGTVRSGSFLVRANEASHAGRRSTSGACRNAVRKSIRSGICGLPQSRECENVQSSVRIRPTAPAARARCIRARI